MAKTYDIAVTVISQKGTCTQGHKVGDKWTIGSKTPEGICAAAFHCLYSDARVLRYGGLFPWATDPTTITVTCPDEGKITFELKQLQE